MAGLKQAEFAGGAAKPHYFWWLMPTMTLSFSRCQRRRPAGTGGGLWTTNRPEEDEDTDTAATFKFGHRYEVTGRSLLLFLLRPARPARRPGKETPVAWHFRRVTRKIVRDGTFGFGTSFLKRAIPRFYGLISRERVSESVRVTRFACKSWTSRATSFLRKYTTSIHCSLDHVPPGRGISGAAATWISIM